MADTHMEQCSKTGIRYEQRDEGELAISIKSLGLTRCSEADQAVMKFAIRDEIRSLSYVKFEGNEIICKLPKAARVPKTLDAFRERILTRLNFESKITFADRAAA